MPYNTLEDIQLRKDELKDNIQQQSGQISTIWRELTTPHPTNTKGEMIAGLIANSITAIDGFLLVRKLIRNYGSFFGIGQKKRR